MNALLPYVLSSGAALLFFSSERWQRSAKRLVASAVVGGLALAYSLWVVFVLDREVVVLGILLLFAGVPVYARVKRRHGREP